MTNEEIIREFASLTPEARRQAENFIAFLRKTYNKNNKNSADIELRQESFVGMWKDRDDLKDSSAFVRNLRETEWTK